MKIKKLKVGKSSNRQFCVDQTKNVNLEDFPSNLIETGVESTKLVGGHSTNKSETPPVTRLDSDALGISMGAESGGTGDASLRYENKRGTSSQ